MKITVTSESRNTGNKSETTTFEIDPGEAAIMIDTDRRERAKRAGLPVAKVAPRSVQQIMTELWRAEENNAHDFYRTDLKYKTDLVSMESRLEAGHDITEAGLSPEDEVIANEKEAEHQAQLARLREALGELPELQRRVLELQFYDGLSKADIARLWGTSRSSVTQTDQVAQKNLRKLMA